MPSAPRSMRSPGGRSKAWRDARRDTPAERGELTGKPRPVLIVQTDIAAALHSTVTICLISSSLTALGHFRVPVAPTPANGLRQPSEIQVDRLFSLRRENIVQRLGALDAATLAQVDAALRHWLAL